MEPVRFRTPLLRTDPRLGLFIRIPAEFVRRWGLTATTTVEGSIEGHPIGRRAIKDSGPKTADWYLSLTKPLTDAIGGEEGEEVEVELRLSDMTLPDEMAHRIETDPEFARAFQALKPNHRRKAIEHYLEAKTAVGRTARLEKISGSIKARLQAPSTNSG